MTDLDLAERVLRLWDFSDPAGSEGRFTEAAAGEPDPLRRQVLLTQVARAQGLQDSFDKGHATLDMLGDPDTLATEPAVRRLLERGRLHNSSADTFDAVPLFREAYERATEAGLGGLAADAAHMIAIASPPEEHEEWFHRGMAAAEGSSDPLAVRMSAALLNNLAWTHADAGRWEEALPLFERAVEARRVAGVPEPLHFARWCRARSLRALGRHEEALAELRELAASPLGADDGDVADEIAANEVRRRD